jgi:hypothetical protein
MSTPHIGADISFLLSFLSHCIALETSPTEEPSPKTIAHIYACESCPHADSLSSNSIGDKGVRELAVALQTNTSLTNLK